MLECPLKVINVFKNTFSIEFFLFFEISSVKAYIKEDSSVSAQDSMSFVKNCITNRRLLSSCVI